MTLEATVEGLMNGHADRRAGRRPGRPDVRGGRSRRAAQGACAGSRYRSALTASLATRLVPVLARDAARMGDAARCRPQPPGRLAVVRAALAGALDRAVDVAAALEVRGYSLAGRPARPAPVSRHDLRIGAAALAIAALAIGGAAAGVGHVEAYPTLDVAAGPAELALASALVLLGGAPLPAAPRGWGWRVPEPLVQAERFSYAYPEGGRPSRCTRSRSSSSRARSRCWPACRGRASRPCCARSAGWCRTSTAARPAGGCGSAASTCASTARASWPPCAAPSSRSPRPRW